MDFDDSTEEADFRQKARSWLKRHAGPKDPGEVRLDRFVARPETEMSKLERAKAWQVELFEGGWAGITWPKEFGGRGGTVVEQYVFDEEQALFDVPVNSFVQGIGLAGPTLIAHGTEAQQQRFLRPMLRGEEVWCQLFSEPGAGSDLAALTTSAVPDGDDYVVNGQKVWTSAAHYSDFGILLARTNRDAPKHRGITFFVVDMKSPGIEVRPITEITGASHFNEVYLTDVRIPSTHVVGPLDGGWGVTLTTLMGERNLIGALRVDDWDALASLARRAGRRSDPLVRQDLARAYSRRRILDYLRWRTITALSQGRQAGPEGSVAKLAYSGHLAALGDLYMSLLGPLGTLIDFNDPPNSRFPLEFLDQWAIRIGGGTDEIQRNVLAERVLDLPRELRPDQAVPLKRTDGHQDTSQDNLDQVGAGSTSRS